MFLNKLINKGYQASQCQLCQTHFNLIKLQRIHKCKRCQKFICNKCGKDRQKIIDKDGKWTQDVHRICTQCKKDFIEIHQTITNNNMHWNINTPMSQEWIKNIKSSLQFNQNQQNSLKSQYQYQHFLDLFLTNSKHFKQQTQIIYKDVIKGRTDSSVYNFSMRQFFYTVKSNIQDEKSRQNIKNVLYSIAGKYNQIGYCQGMSSIAAFILCFSSQQNAFVIFCDLLQNILPYDLFLQGKYGQSLSGLMAETYFIQEYFMHLIENVKRPLIQVSRQIFYDQNQLSHFRTVIQLLVSKVLLSVFVGIVSFSICIFIWQQLKQYRSFNVIQKAFIAIIYMNSQKILQNRSFKIIQQEIQRINLQEFKQFYYDVQIDQQIKQQFINKYQQNISNKWNPNSDHQMKKLHKITKFSQKQILKLKQAYPQSQQQKISIKIEQFIEFVKQFYEILSKQKYFLLNQLYNSENICKIVKKYNKSNKNGLDLRQFLTCLSHCIKSNLIKRLTTIIQIFQQQIDNKHFIKLQNFIKTLKNLIKSINQQQNNKNHINNQIKFIQKIQKLYITIKNENKYINVKNIKIILNDNYIYSLSKKLQFDTQNILLTLINKRKQNKLKY